ncbi:MAG TPA: hypothetical protein VNX68_09210, partial [Nitrosopumilaceae archaeon]|nr:hypothetical protein [Nitrosopumilaceae archaeon]
MNKKPKDDWKCGQFSGIPGCCIKWFTEFWWEIHTINFHTKSRTVSILCHSYIRRYNSIVVKRFGKGVGYIICPKCIINKNVV